MPDPTTPQVYPELGEPARTDAPLPPAVTPSGEPYPHECMFRHLLRDVGLLAGLTPDEDGLFHLDAVARRIHEMRTELERLRSELLRNDQLLEVAWGLVVNVDNGTWSQRPGWQAAAEAWRDAWQGKGTLPGLAVVEPAGASSEGRPTENQRADQLDGRAETMAAPIPESVGHLRPEAAERVEYVAVAVCRHCTDAVVRCTEKSPWVHREHGTASCLADRIRRYPAELRSHG